MDIKVTIADDSHQKYAEEICQLMEEAAHKRGTGIAKREPGYIRAKMRDGKAIIALDGDKFIGFSYVESWSNKEYVANSGLIVHPDYRGQGLGKKIKHKIFELSRKKYPKSKIFGITTSLAVMKINSDLGYEPVTFSELTRDDTFWDGCQSCPNYDILNSNNRKNCLCTGMLYDPEEQKKKEKKRKQKEKEENWERFKRFLKLKKHQIIRKTESILKFKIGWQ